MTTLTKPERYARALEGLQAQSAAAGALLEQSLRGAGRTRKPLADAQEIMLEFDVETRVIWSFVMSGAAKKTLPEVTIEDLNLFF